MALAHLYLAIENIALNATQRDTLIDALKRLGKRDGGSAFERMQPLPVRADGQAIIIEATFETGEIGSAQVRQFLATTFSVTLASVTQRTDTPDFGDGSSVIRIVTRSGVDYLRFIVFGGINASFEQSNAEVRAYLALHKDEWN